MQQIVAGFSPWMVYIAGSTVDRRFGAGAGAAVAIALLLRARRQGSADLLTRLTACWFVVLVPVTLVWPVGAGYRFVPSGALGLLGLGAAASLARDPFTLALARRVTPPEVWERPAFIRANRVITAVWAASMLVGAALIAATLTVWPAATGAAVATQVAAFVVPAAFTRLYRARRQRAVRRQLVGQGV